MPSSPALKQRHLLFGSREFMIKGNTSLLIREKSLLRQNETLIPLSTLQPNPTLSSSFSIKWLLNSLLTFALSILFFYWARHLSLPALYIPGAVFSLATLLFCYRFFLYTTRLTIFRHAHTNENYLFLWRDRPNQQQFGAFITLLTRAIQKNQTS